MLSENLSLAFLTTTGVICYAMEAGLERVEIADVESLKAAENIGTDQTAQYITQLIYAFIYLTCRK